MVVQRLVCSYPADLSDWGRQALGRPAFRSYLRRVHDTASEGDVWAEFVGVGCCGNTLDVALRVERVEGDGPLGEETTVEYVEREECAGGGGWQVQSAHGPTG